MIRSLIARGADEHSAEDIAQEVALRAMDRDLEFSDVDDFCRWGCTVAKNLYVDQTRLRLRVVAMTEVPDWAGDPDVPEQVEHRINLRRALRGLAMLGETDRTAIVAGVNEEVQGNRRIANRSAVRRHRARTRLLRLVEGIAALVGLTKGVRRTLQTTVVAVAVSTAAVVLLPDIAPWQFGEPSDRGAGPASAQNASATASMNRVQPVREGTGANGLETVPAAAAATSPGAGPATSAPRDDGPVSSPVSRPRRAQAMAPGDDGGTGVQVYEEEDPPLLCTLGGTPYRICVDRPHPEV